MKEVLQFLQELSENNNKPWFEANKKRYLEAKAKMEQLAVELVAAIRSFDDTIGPLSPKDCTWRIYRDVRFSKDKRPYKTQMGVFVAKGGKKSKAASEVLQGVSPIVARELENGMGLYDLRSHIANPEPTAVIIDKPKDFTFFVPEQYGELAELNSFGTCSA